MADFKYRNGATTRLDVTQGQSNLSQTEAFIPPLEAARRQAANQLCILMGMPPRDMERVLGMRTIPLAPPRVAVGIPADLLRRRPDVRRAERQAAAQIRADRHRRSPNCIRISRLPARSISMRPTSSDLFDPRSLRRQRRADRSTGTS